jgi:Tat protein secretion system quality control protein TatD with DNase activity
VFLSSINLIIHLFTKHTNMLTVFVSKTCRFGVFGLVLFGNDFVTCRTLPTIVARFAKRTSFTSMFIGHRCR